jgi:hypothetical protein
MNSSLIHILSTTIHYSANLPAAQDTKNGTQGWRLELEGQKEAPGT